MISLDDHRCNIVVLEIALRELPSGLVDTIRDIRSRLVAQGPHLIKHTRMRPRCLAPSQRLSVKNRPTMTRLNVIREALNVCARNSCWSLCTMKTWP